ncbi:DUF1297 domain-containing protein [Candidatus Micrarchaeota archaeon]|nr:DUF1297 domain-containing protein [Candidatus Micrarchaeota archaeon]
MKHAISTLGSHSALDVSEGAKKEGFRTLVVCKRGRENTYLNWYKSRKRGKREIGVVDEIVLVNEFKQIASHAVVEHLKKSNAVFVPNRSFSVYVGYDTIENEFPIPIFGNRKLLRAEERDQPNNQYDLLKKSGINYPKEVLSPEKIQKLSIVKVNEAERSYERAFFFASDYEEYKEKSSELLKHGKIREDDLKKARIEEFVIGAPFNFNFFYSPIHDELELLGVDMRKQTDIDGYLKMPADIQLDVLKKHRPKIIEVGHIACTVRESLIEGVYEQAEKFAETVAKEYSPGIIGPFALQGAIEEVDGKEQFTTFDVSFRMPGSPGTRFTPYSEYLFRESISFGRRIAMELKDAEKGKKIDLVTT